MPDETTRTTLASGGSEGTQGNTAQAGAQSLGWRAGVASELRDHPMVKGAGNVTDFARQAVDLYERNGKSFQVPGDNATPEELAAFRKAIGVPETEDGYTFDPSKLPKDWKSSPDFDAWFKKAAREAGLTTKAAQALYFTLQGRVSEEAQKALAADKADEEREAKEIAERRKKYEADLRAEYKGEYESNIKAAGQVARLLGGEELIKELDENLLGDSPRLIRALVKASKLISPDSLVADRQAGQKPSDNDRKDLPLQYPWMREFYGKPIE